MKEQIKISFKAHTRCHENIWSIIDSAKADFVALPVIPTKAFQKHDYYPFLGDNKTAESTLNYKCKQITNVSRVIF
jgi:hypothetical protein